MYNKSYEDAATDGPISRLTTISYMGSHAQAPAASVGARNIRQLQCADRDRDQSTGVDSKLRLFELDPLNPTCNVGVQHWQCTHYVAYPSTPHASSKLNSPPPPTSQAVRRATVGLFLSLTSPELLPNPPVSQNPSHSSHRRRERARGPHRESTCPSTGDPKLGSILQHI